MTAFNGGEIVGEFETDVISIYIIVNSGLGIHSRISI